MPSFSTRFAILAFLVRPWLLPFSFGLLASFAAIAGEKPGFSTEPPAIYAEKLDALLTPAEAALAAAVSLETRAEAGEDGSLILAESVVWVAPDGRTYRVAHLLQRANTEAVVKELGRESTFFRPTSESAFLVLARTLPPGGEWQTVRPDAAFVQSPQERADDHLFTDRAELVVVFPQVRIGSVTELIVLTEEPVSRIPGQLTEVFHLSGGWSSDQRRVVIELPAAMADRLRVTPIGAAPERRRIDLPDGRSRFEWKVLQPARMVPEPRMAPRGVTGPAIFVTTLAGWQELADWYRGLLAGRDELPPELHSKIEEWSRDAKTPLEIVRALHRHVADDIRYTGLEFGLAGYQPKTPAEVWGNLYGDCKDKANLLRALLAAKGIRSHLALLSTEHRGLIEKRSPDFRHFDHAILAIELPGQEELLWADPTIPYLDPGELGPGSGGREALLVEADGWRFATTTPPTNSRLRAKAEVEVGAGGSREGFLEIEAEKFGGASFRHIFAGDQNARLRKARDLVQGFFPRATVIDVEAKAAEPPAGRDVFRLRIYFTVEGLATAADGQDQLPAAGRGLFDTEIDQREARRSDFTQRLQTFEIDLSYRLPAGWVPRQLPAPFAVEVPALSSSAAWTCEPGLCRLSMRQENRQAAISPADFPAYHQTKKAFGAWLSRPLSLEHGESPASPAAVAASLGDFPLMPTGAGQLRLLEHKFPYGRQDGLRRAALEQTLQWFPADPGTVFDAEVELGRLDCGAGAAAAGAERLRRALARLERAVPPDDLAWGRFVLAGCEGVADDEVIALLRRTVEEPGLHAQRRGWALLLWAEKLETPDPKGALELYGQALQLADAVNDKSYAGVAWAGRIRLLALLADPGLEAEVAAAFAAADGEVLAGQLVGSVSRLAELDRAAAADRLFGLLEKEATVRGSLEPVLAELRATRDGESAARVHAGIAADLARVFAEDPPPWWSSYAVDAAESVEAAAAKTENFAAEPGLARFVRQAAHLLTDYPPTAEFSQRLYQIAWCFNQEYSEAPQIEKIFGLLEQLPKSDDNHWEGKFLRGAWLVRRGDSEAASALYRRALADPALRPPYPSVFASRNFEAALAGERFAEAARIFAELEPAADLAVPAVLDGLARAILLSLEEGRPEEAGRYLQRLAEAGDEVVEKTSSPFQIGSLRALAAHPEWAREAWRNQQDWWPDWALLGKKLGAKAGRQPATELVDLAEVEGQVDQLLQQSQLAAAFGAMEGLAHAARWDPGVAVSLAGTLGNLAESSLGADIYAFQVKLLRSLPAAPVADQRARQLLMLGAALIDSDRDAEALAPLRELVGLEITSPLRQNGAALLGLAAGITGEGLEEARDHLSRLLDDSFPADNRAFAVATLADLYIALGQFQEAGRLLEREVANPVFAGKAELADLEDRLAASRHGGSGDLFDLALADLLKRFPLPFLALAEPASLDDKRVAGKTTEELWEGDWLPAERVKLALLLASDRRRPVAEKSAALRPLLIDLGQALPSRNRYHEILRAVAAESRFPEALRGNANFALAVDRGDRRELEQLGALLDRPDLELNPRARGIMKAQRELLAAANEGPEALELFVAALLSKRLDAFQTSIFPEAFFDLVLRGAEGAALRLAPRLEKLETSETAEADDLRLKAERALVEIGESRRLLELLRGKASAAPPGVARSAASGDITAPRRLESLSAAQCREVLADDLRDLFLKTPLESAWLGFYLFCQEREDGSPRLALDILRAVLELEVRDETKADWLRTVAFALGDDEPLWPEVLAAGRAATDKAELPETEEALQHLEALRRHRAGGKIDFETEKRNAAGLERGLWLTLEGESLLGHGEKAAAKAFLASHSAAELKSAYGLAGRLALARLAPELPESKWVEKAARRQIYENQLEAMASCSWTAAITVIDFSALLDGGASYDQDWFAAVLDCQQGRVGRAALELADAEARKDWQAAYTSARRLIEFEAPDHDDQFRLGRAAFEIGKMEEAKKALLFYLEAVKNHRDEAAAREMLARLEKGP